MQWETNAEPAVLFVCLGNICRSPMAEGAFRQAATDAGLKVAVDSAGTASYHIGTPPDPRAIKVARRHGVDIAQGRGRQLCEQDFEQFTHIFALDTANLAGIEARAPRYSQAKVALLLDAIDGCAGQSVADPYYGDESDFEECWSQISRATEHLVERFKRQMA
ncbi:low molecular weight phosphotyrosine protein phosphatase [Erythrobacter sp. SCSIO 43205]|uniref:low molecular weight protein-tyrosine-phosphatase n=1 Tax=Erythrobacter sp. SCSIO 43205 TaxID=2779361 RepID=UPI001CA9F051|nr:low molecular weight protein-tyrosine-phosphatase [Erythrobacter sp. SCSIO 43205]UAB76934.1 low molecular weight phosphotyrosine protein phosphatase [Erythrobacter sp. SCSIO 43205]